MTNTNSSSDAKAVQVETTPVQLKEQAASMTPDQLKARILKQVEFYFCDSNIVNDKFMKGEVAKNEEGWVEIKVIASFKRMKALTEDLEVVAAALRGSKVLLKVSEDGTKVKRTSPIPESFDSAPMTVRVKNIPTTASLDAIEEFLQSRVAPEGNVRRVKKLFNRKTKEFIGKAFVEFDSEETAKAQHNVVAVAEGEEFPEEQKTTSDVVFQEAKLVIEHLSVWRKRKGKKWGELKKGKNGKRARDGKKVFKVDKVCDRILHLDGIPAGTTFAQIKEELGKHGGVRFVEFKEGDTSAFVRMYNGHKKVGEGVVGTTELSAKKVLAQFQAAGATINGGKVACRALEGEEEEAHWVKLTETLKASQSNKRQRR